MRHKIEVEKHAGVGFEPSRIGITAEVSGTLKQMGKQKNHMVGMIAEVRFEAEQTA
jgi:hypothetical protein